MGVYTQTEFLIKILTLSMTYFSGMCASFWVPVVHVIAGQAKDLVHALSTTYNGSGSST